VDKYIETNNKTPKLLDFSGDILEAVTKLESVLCNTPWYQHLNIYDDAPNEAKVLIKLLREKAIVIGEVYYTPLDKVTDEVRKKANEYLDYLYKKNVDSDLLNIAGLYSKHEFEKPPSDRNALLFPHIKAYIRCGDLSPEKLFQLLQKDGCERVIVFNGAQPDENSPEEAFYSFEMQAPKEYIIGKLAELQEERCQAYYRTMEKVNDIIPDVVFTPLE